MIWDRIGMKAGPGRASGFRVRLAGLDGSGVPPERGI